MVQNLDPKLLQIALTGFLEKNTSLFVKVQSLACVNPACLHLLSGHMEFKSLAKQSHMHKSSGCSLHPIDIETQHA